MQERKARLGKATEDLHCELCEVREPELHPDNMELWRLLCLCSTQWRVGMAGAYGMDYMVIIEAAKAMEIDIGQQFFEKISVYERTALEAMNKKTDKTQPSERTAGNA